MRVLVFGASITQGFWDTQGGWVNRLWEHYTSQQVKNLREERQPTVFNLGISGDTTKDVLGRFDNEVKARLWPGEDLLFIFAVGTNNAISYPDRRSEPSLDEYQAELESLVAKARKFSDKILFVEIVPCDEKLTKPVFGADIYYTNEKLGEVNKRMKAVCAKNNLNYVPTFDVFQNEAAKGRKLLSDGLHPNNDGHKFIFQLVQPELDKLIQ